MSHWRIYRYFMLFHDMFMTTVLRLFVGSNNFLFVSMPTFWSNFCWNTFFIITIRSCGIASNQQLNSYNIAMSFLLVKLTLDVCTSIPGWNKWLWKFTGGNTFSSVDSVNDTLGDPEQKLHQDSAKSTENPHSLNSYSECHEESSSWFQTSLRLRLSKDPAAQ